MMKTSRVFFALFFLYAREEFDPYTLEMRSLVTSKAKLVYSKLGLEMPHVPQV